MKRFFVFGLLGLAALFGVMIMGPGAMAGKGPDDPSLTQPVSAAYPRQTSEAIPNLLDEAVANVYVKFGADVEVSPRLEDYFGDAERRTAWLNPNKYYADEAELVGDGNVHLTISAGLFLGVREFNIYWGGEKLTEEPFVAPKVYGVRHLYDIHVFIGGDSTFEVALDAQRKVVWCGPSRGWCTPPAGHSTMPRADCPSGKWYKPGNGEPLECVQD